MLQNHLLLNVQKENQNANNKLLEEMWNKLLVEINSNFREFHYLTKELLDFVRNPATPDYLLEAIFE